MEDRYKSRRSDEAYAALEGGTDTLLSRFFLAPGGSTQKVGAEEKAAWFMMKNASPEGEDTDFCRKYSDALRTALKAAALKEDADPDNRRWTFSGDGETVQRLAVQAATAAGITLDEGFLARLSTMSVNQLTPMVTVHFMTAA